MINQRVQAAWVAVLLLDSWRAAHSGQIIWEIIKKQSKEQ